jgi:hypothetical protein
LGRRELTPAAIYAACLRDSADAAPSYDEDAEGMSHRALIVGILGTAAILGIGVWGIVNLVEGDWFIGGLFVGCALVSLQSLVTTVRRMRREEHAGRRDGGSSHGRTTRP